MRRGAGGQQQHAIEREGALRRRRRIQMAEMDRIERSAQNADVHGFVS